MTLIILVSNYKVRLEMSLILCQCKVKVLVRTYRLEWVKNNISVVIYRRLLFHEKTLPVKFFLSLQ